MRTAGGALAGLLLVLAAAAPPAAAFERELQRYYATLVDICRTGVTPEISRAYEAAASAVDRAGYGGGRGNNFFGVKTPEQAWLDCFQSPDGRD
jgi:hypothetical protein